MDLGLGLFLLWWSGYSAALIYFVPNRCDIEPKDVVRPLIQAIFWPISLPASLLAKRFMQKLK